MTKKTILIAGSAFVVGIVAAAVITFLAMPKIMMIEDASPYPFDQTVSSFEESVQAEGWTILQVHDMQGILAGRGFQVNAVKIYELCSSRYSAEILALDDERIVAPLMPCRVAIYEKSDGTTYIGRMNSGLMARTFGGVIDRIMRLASADTEKMIARVLNGETTVVAP